jgi:drug/metabolite transporter (DMT)-like permease
MQSGDRYLTLALASVTALLCLVALIFNILTLTIGDDFIREPTRGQPINYIWGLVGMLAAVSVIWFWLRMLNDFFRNRPENHPVAWGWALFVLTFGAALAYFWFIWRPRNEQLRATDA